MATASVIGGRGRLRFVGEVVAAIEWDEWTRASAGAYAGVRLAGPRVSLDLGLTAVPAQYDPLTLGGAAAASIRFVL